MNENYYAIFQDAYIGNIIGIKALTELKEEKEAIRLQQL